MVVLKIFDKFYLQFFVYYKKLMSQKGKFQGLHQIQRKVYISVFSGSCVKYHKKFRVFRVHYTHFKVFKVHQTPC